MFEGKGIFQILQIGGFTIWVLLFCSILSIAVIFERIRYFRTQTEENRESFIARIKNDLINLNIKGVLEMCSGAKSPFERIISSGLSMYGSSMEKIQNAMDRQITTEIKAMEKYTAIIGTIGSTAVYIGLFGTVIGIIQAFHDISAIGGGGVNIVIGGIAEALICTATGISVAVPAVMVYNYFMKRIDNLTSDMDLCVSEVMDILKK
jgi:biopolymer transport protein ExbB